jgi:hypothetical protein
MDSLHCKVRAELNERGAKKLTQKEWEEVQIYNDDEHQPGPLALADHVEKCRRKKAELPLVADGHEKRDLDAELGEFMWARSLLYVALAEQEAGVREFRKEVLADEFLYLKDVSEWVERHRQAEGPATTYVRVVAPPGWRRGDTLTSAESAGHSLDVLKYHNGGDSAAAVAVARGGVLDRLRELSNRLALRYEWQSAQASTFVLTGDTPIVSMFTTTRNIGHRERVKFDIDADTPVELVTKAFTDYRRSVLGKRARKPSAGLKVVIHAETNPGVTGRALLRSWNTANPDNKYTDVRAFNQTLRNATRRVMGVPRG